MTNKPNSRPSSASANADDSAGNTRTSSRPSSTNQKASESSASIPTATSSSRSASVNQKTDIIGRPNSRPSSASQKQNKTTSDDSNTQQENTSILFNFNDPNVTQPIIERPPSVAKNITTNEANSTTIPDAATSLDVLTANALSNDENEPIEIITTPRIGSASKSLPAVTTIDKQ